MPSSVATGMEFIEVKDHSFLAPFLLRYIR